MSQVLSRESMRWAAQVADQTTRASAGRVSESLRPLIEASASPGTVDHLKQAGALAVPSAIGAALVALVGKMLGSNMPLRKVTLGGAAIGAGIGFALPLLKNASRQAPEPEPHAKAAGDAFKAMRASL